MTSFKYFIMLFMAMFLTTLVLSGCGSKGTTTKLRLTPIRSMADETINSGETDPQKLTEELDVLLQSEDSKRMKRLQEAAKAKAEKVKNPSGQKVGEIK